MLAPEGTEVNATLWVAELSWSTHVIVEPAVTVMLEGEKFEPEPAP